MSNRYVGIDPGVTGAIAVIHKSEVIMLVDNPTHNVLIGKTRRNIPSWGDIATYFEGHKDDYFVIEKSAPMVRDGSSAAFGTGRFFGGLEALVSAYSVQVMYVTPAKWKRRLGLLKQTKDASRKKAIELFPDAACDLHLKKHHGRAEAILIAEYGRMVRENNE